MEFWERNDKGCKKIAAWDGKTWSGPGAKSVQSVLDQYWPTLNGPFDPDKHWDKLEKLISGSRLWVVVGDKKKESTSVDDLFPEETLSISISEPRDVSWPLVIDLGGPTSGHKGHRSIPGARGGSAPRSGYFMMIQQMDGWDELPRDKKAAFASAANGVPDGHLKNFRGIAFETEAIDRRFPEDRKVAGIYHHNTWSIGLHSENATPNTITHELGHHVMSQMHGKVLREINGEYQGTLVSWIKEGQSLTELDAKVLGSGLRHYSATTVDEFWADSYSLWVRAGGGDKNCRVFQKTYREYFPDTAETLDGIFGGH